MGEKEATVALFCPKAAYDEPKVRKVEMNTSNLSLIIVLAGDQSSSWLHV